MLFAGLSEFSEWDGEQGLIILFRFQRAGELVGAGRAVAALHSLQERDDVFYLAADDEPRDALRVPRASADEFTLRDDAVRHLVVDRA